MADDAIRDNPGGTPPHDSDIDSIMVDSMAEIEEQPLSPPGRPASPMENAASPGLFVAQSTEPATPAPENPMPSRAAIDAMKQFQRDMAQQLLAESAPSPSHASQAAGDSEDDGISGMTPYKNDAQAREFFQLQSKYLKKKEKEKASMVEDITYQRMKAAEEARQRKMRLDDEADKTDSDADENELFVDADLPPVPDLRGDSQDQAEKPKKRGRKRKADAVGDDEVRPAKKRAPKSHKVAGQGYSDADLDEILAQGKGEAKKTKSAPKKAKPRSKQGKAAGHSMTNTRTLYGTDLFHDAEMTHDLPAQPTHEGGTRRADAMKQLIASVPTEARQTARADKKMLDDACKEFNGHRSIRPAPDGNWELDGLKTTLKHYQVLGVAFARKRENGTAQPRGGIIADSMGLGKTLMTLANIVNGRPPAKKRTLRTTLIVASPALVNQWLDEIQKHCTRKSESKQHGIGDVLQHRAGHRLDKHLMDESLQNAEIILTTYGEVVRSYPKADPPKELTTAKQKDEWWQSHYNKEKGLLHRLKFLRVVIDEAQCIRNHKSATSMACRALTARHYWALTGTPVYNTVADFYSIFKFLREPNTGSYKIFKANFCDANEPDSLERLNAFLRKLMVRRTHQDKMFGAKLLDIPKPHQKTVKLEFSPIERQIYEIVKTRMVSHINSISQKEGTAGLQKRYSHIWALILRLRQLCGHVLLLGGKLLEILVREDFEKLNRLANAEEEEVGDEGAALLVHLRTALSSKNNTISTVEGADGATLSETQIVATGTVDIGNVEGEIGRGHGLSFRFSKYLRALAKSEHWQDVTDRMTCVACRNKPVNPYISDCFHIYCLVCLTDMQHHAARRGMDSMKCAECGEMYTNAQPCDSLESLAEDLSSISPTDTQVTGKKKKKAQTQEDDLIELPGEILCSAKTRAAKAQILAWLEEEPLQKIIIYSQFIPMIRILEKVCRSERWGFSLYTGNMSQDARTNSLGEFADKPEKKILLASLRAGGLGLNLTMASRVLLLDPWWNSAVEQQAFARVYRIGQDKPTQLTRLVITNTIDSAMMAIKARKDEDIEVVMNDARREEQLDIKDLMRLFGPLGEDDEGRAFIFPSGEEGDEGQEHLRYARMESDDEEAFMGNEE